MDCKQKTFSSTKTCLKYQSLKQEKIKDKRIIPHHSSSAGYHARCVDDVFMEDEYACKATRDAHLSKDSRHRIG